MFTSPEKQVEKADDLSFINTAAELVEAINKHAPKVDVSALGSAMAQTEVHKAVDLGVTHEQLRESVDKTVADKPSRKLPIVDVNRSSFPMEDVVKITKQKDKSCTTDSVKKKRRIQFIGKQVLSMTMRVHRDIVHAMSAACVGIAGINMSMRGINLRNATIAMRN